MTQSRGPAGSVPVVTAAGRTHAGARDGNEDALYQGDRVLAVADGMGGHPGGDIASGRAVEVMAELDQKPRMTEAAVVGAVVAANGRIHQPNRPRRRRMGTTLTVVALADWTAYIAHVGDTRAYLFRDGKLARLTSDHTLAAEAHVGGDSGRARATLTRSLGTGKGVEVDHASHPLQAGDRLLLSSDGLHDQLDDEVIAGILGRHAHAGDCADALLERGLSEDPTDNLSVLVADLA
jgi:PPM family protein phosphatase